MKISRKLCFWLLKKIYEKNMKKNAFLCKKRNIYNIIKYYLIKKIFDDN